ncbi:MAG: sensor histidine kinase [Alphaproteobacteria bacterium]
MSDKQKINFATNKNNLKQLLFLRLLAILVEIFTIFFVDIFLKISLPLPLIFATIFLQLIFFCLSCYRYFKVSITDFSLFLELIFDVLFFSILIYLSNGISNPFISLFLLQIIIAIIVLKPLFSWLITILTFISYIFLTKFSYQINFLNLQNDHHHGYGLHLQGMLINYLILAILLMIFIGKIIKNIRIGQNEIHKLQQQALKLKQIEEMALFTTNSAHRLGSPLTTIAIILADLKNIFLLKNQNFDQKNLVNEIEFMEKQIAKCKNILSEILSNSSKSRLEEMPLENLQKASQNLIKKWQDEKNFYDFEVNYNFTKLPNFIFDEALNLAIYNVFDNAFNARKKMIKINFFSDDKNLKIEVFDDGLGFNKEMLKKIGNFKVPSKTGSGLGLYLTILTIEKIGGNLLIENLKNHGSKVTILIPLNYA